jgi:hypothetical protein
MANNFRNRIIGFDTKPADQFQANPQNWRKHPKAQQAALNRILGSVGWVTGVIENVQTGNLIDGHERIWQALETNEDVPFLLVDLSPEEENLVLAAFDSISHMAQTDEDQLKSLITQINDWNPEFADLTSVLAAEMGVDLNPFDKPVGVPSSRKLPLDLYFTCGSIGKTALDEPTITNSVCCLAVRCGLKYGIQSTGSGGVCPCTPYITGHEIGFIDNDYFHYDHEMHLAAVAKWTPKYATVRDVMTQSQCHKDEIEYYPLEQILEWAEELSEHATNVIVIPKYDCIDQIPEKFVLGYSVPTSHGGTPLPPEMFRGRRVHLLGGSWKDQLAHMAVLQDDVVSADNNYILRISDYGQFITRDGKGGQVKDIDPTLIAPRWIALSISLAVMATDCQRLYLPEG